MKIDFSPLRKEIELLPTLVGYFNSLEEADSLVLARPRKLFHFMYKEGGY